MAFRAIPEAILGLKCAQKDRMVVLLEAADAIHQAWLA
jgi:hypothetical protein